MAQYVNAFGTSNFNNDKQINDIKDISDLIHYQLRTQNDKINFIINNLPSNEQNTILMDEIKKEQGQIRTEIEEMKKIFISINQIMGRVENIEKKIIETENELQRRSEVIKKNNDIMNKDIKIFKTQLDEIRRLTHTHPQNS
jgi:hypothetical protein